MRRLMPLLLLLPMAGIAGAGDPLTFDYKDVPVKTAIEVLATIGDKRILLDPEYHEARLTLKVKGTLDDCLSKLAVTIGAKLFDDGNAYHIVPKWQHEVLETLHNGPKLTLTFENESTRNILSVIATYCGVSIVMDPELGDPKATVQLANATIATALEKTLGKNEAGYDLRYGVVFVATTKRLAALPKRVRIDVPARLRDERFLFSLNGESVARILKVVARKAGLVLEIAKEIEPALGKRNTTLQLRQVRIEHVLAAILTPVGAKAEIRDGKLIVSKA